MPLQICKASLSQWRIQGLFGKRTAAIYTWIILMLWCCIPTLNLVFICEGCLDTWTKSNKNVCLLSVFRSKQRQQQRDSTEKRWACLQGINLLNDIGDWNVFRLLVITYSWCEIRDTSHPHTHNLTFQSVQRRLEMKTQTKWNNTSAN